MVTGKHLLTSINVVGILQILHTQCSPVDVRTISHPPQLLNACPLGVLPLHSGSRKLYTHLSSLRQLKVPSLSHTLNSCMRSISQQLSFSFCPPHPFLPQGNETDQPTTELGHCGWCHSVVHICGSEGHTNGGPHYCHRAL